jgi:hypothetical protein
VVREDRMLMPGKEAVISAIGDPATCTINAQQPEQFAGLSGSCNREQGCSRPVLRQRRPLHEPVV